MTESRKRIRKVYYGQYPKAAKRHPVIHIEGKYLAQLNFHIGDHIEIALHHGQIIITKVNRETNPTA